MLDCRITNSQSIDRKFVSQQRLYIKPNRVREPAVRSQSIWLLPSAFENMNMFMWYWEINCKICSRKTSIVRRFSERCYTDLPGQQELAMKIFKYSFVALNKNDSLTTCEFSPRAYRKNTSTKGSIILATQKLSASRPERRQCLGSSIQSFAVVPVPKHGLETKAPGRVSF